MHTYKLRLRVPTDGTLTIELPVSFSDTDVEVLVIVQPLTAPAVTSDPISQPKDKSRYQEMVARARKKYARAYEPWQKAEESQLRHLYQSNRTLSEIAGILQRNPGAIRGRLRKLGFDVPETQYPIVETPGFTRDSVFQDED